MNKFKIFFYPIYLLVTLVTLYYSIDILSNQQAYMERVNDFATLRKLPQYLLTVVLIISLLMLIEFTIENIHLYRIRKRVSASEAELLNLKARLYDKSDSESHQAIVQNPSHHDKPRDKQEDDYLFDDREERD